MNGGLINCDCGQEFYCETVNASVKCIRCGKSHEVYSLPEPEVVVEEEYVPEEGAK